MTIAEIIQEVKDAFDMSLIEQYDGFIAVQVNVTQNPCGVFYIEIKNHHLSVEPYDYYDRNAALSVTADDFRNIMKRRLDPVLAFTNGKLKLDGDPGKVLELLKFVKSSSMTNA